MPNAQQGILIEQGAWANTIGGTASGTGNLISANHWGIAIEGGPASGGSAMNWIAGNRIGTDITGQLPLGNEIDGIEISGSSGNTIGGTAASEGNTIAFNTFDGIEIVSGTGDEILTNSIFANGVLGIALDGSSNDQIPSATIHDALPDPALSTTQIDGSYTGQASSIYLIQFFSTPGGVAKGDVEGEVFIGSTTLKTGSAGPAGGPVTETFSTDMDTAVTPGVWITDTVTFLSAAPGETGLNAGDTSEFSSRPVTAVDPFLVISTADQATNPALGTLRYAINYSNANPAPTGALPNEIDFEIPGSGLQTISLLASLDIDKPVTINGYSQPGAQVNNSSEDPRRSIPTTTPTDRCGRPRDPGRRLGDPRQ